MVLGRALRLARRGFETMFWGSCNVPFHPDHVTRASGSHRPRLLLLRYTLMAVATISLKRAQQASAAAEAEAEELEERGRRRNRCQEDAAVEAVRLGERH